MQKYGWGSLIQLHDSIAKEYRIVGSSMIFFKDNKIAYEHYRGYADKATRRKVNNKTIYHWASITKTLTAIAILQLRDAKKLKLDDPLIKYVPELEKVKNPFGKMKDITIQHILTHSAGFRTDTWPGKPDKSGTWKEFIKSILADEIRYRPGSRFSYSNPAFNFLGHIIEKQSGMGYEAYMQKHIFDPLGMIHSYFNITPKSLLRFRSNNYSISKKKMTVHGLDFKTGVTVANGGLNAPCSDMAKYIDFLCNGGSILKRSSLKGMWKPYHVIERNKDITARIGLSFFILDKNKQRYIGHTGSQRGYICFMYVHPKNKTGCIVNLNTNWKDKVPNTRAELYKIRNELFDHFMM